MRSIELTFALRNLRRSPGLSLLMAASLAFGVAAWQAGTLLADRLADSGRPLSDDLYLVLIDDHDPLGQGDEPGMALNKVVYVESMLAHGDVEALLRSPAPVRASPSLPSTLLVGTGPDARPARVRLCGRDLFALFALDLERGAPWSAADEQGGRPVAVISGVEARRQFGTVDVVGRSMVIGGRTLTIVGVVDVDLEGRGYDLVGAIQSPEVAFVPWTLGEALDAGFGWGVPHVSGSQSHAELMASRTRFIALWVELPAERRAAFEAALQAHAATLARPDRPPPRGWLMGVPEFRRLAAAMMGEVDTWRTIAVVILIACALNLGRLLLARTLSRPAEIALIRSIGATRLRVFLQGEAEAVLLGLMAALIALPLSALLVAVLQVVLPLVEVPLRMRAGDALAMTALAVGLSAVAGLIPAWRAARVPPRALREMN